MSMVRITIDIDGDDTLATKEAVAMLLEPLGKVRIVSVDDGKGKKSACWNGSSSQQRRRRHDL